MQGTKNQFSGLYGDGNGANTGMGEVIYSIENITLGMVRYGRQCQVYLSIMSFVLWMLNISHGVFHNDGNELEC